MPVSTVRYNLSNYSAYLDVYYQSLMEEVYVIGMSHSSLHGCVRRLLE